MIEESESTETSEVEISTFLIPWLDADPPATVPGYIRSSKIEPADP
jgi:hypothetical protein